jgi:hypothetical protein
MTAGVTGYAKSLYIITDRQTDRQTDRGTDRQTDRGTDRHKEGTDRYTRWFKYDRGKL